MQELDVQPTNPTPYTPVGGTYNNNPVPGAGGLPSLSGLTRNVNPMAQQLQAQGRGEDSMLVHMTPDEVNSLRGLAQKFGGDLTTNPNTGLPEAGWLGKLLPTIIGLAGAAVGVPTWALAGGTAVGQTALTGDLNKGLMAGLGAWGGASLAGGLGIGEAGKKAAEVAGKTAAEEAAKQSAAKAVGSAGAAGAGVGANAGITAAENAFLTQAGGSAVPGVVTPKVPGFFDKFQAASRIGMPGGIIGKAAPYAAGLGTLGAISDATAPQMPKYQPEEDKWNYEGPYLPAPRRLRPTPTGGGEGEIMFFDETNPLGYMTRTGERRYAEGGQTTSSSNAASSPADMLDSYTRMFRSTAGPITASANYVGGSPSERIQEAMRAAAAAKTGTNTTTTTSGTGTNTATTTAGTTGTTGTTGTNANNTGFSFDATTNTLYYNGQPYTFGTNMPGTTVNTAGTSGTGTNTATTTTGTNINTRPFTGTGEADFGFPLNAGLTPYNPMATDMGSGSIYDYVANNMEDFYGQNSSGSRDTFNNNVQMNAKGGSIRMDDGAFVVDARTVSELGNGSSSAGQELLARLGGRPVKGPGDGVSDSIPANIGGTQEARVARDEVIIPAAAVKRLGGAKKLYALMEKAHKARKKAKRGEDTKVAKGLGALA